MPRKPRFTLPGIPPARHKDHLVRGYTLNERRLRERGIKMEQAVQLLSRTLTRHELVTEEGRGVLDVIARYAKSLNLYAPCVYT